MKIYYQKKYLSFFGFLLVILLLTSCIPGIKNIFNSSNKEFIIDKVPKYVTVGDYKVEVVDIALYNNLAVAAFLVESLTDKDYNCYVNFLSKTDLAGYSQLYEKNISQNKKLIVNFINFARGNIINNIEAK